MSTPNERRSGPAKPASIEELAQALIERGLVSWMPLKAVPGYWISTDGRICREIKVRTNKNGTRWARVSIKGKQHVIRV